MRNGIGSEPGCMELGKCLATPWIAIVVNHSLSYAWHGEAMVTLAAFCGTLGSYSPKDFNKEPIIELTDKFRHRPKWRHSTNEETIKSNFAELK